LNGDATNRGGLFVTHSTKGVFLSYASEDAGVAKRICDALHAASIDVWFDQSELRGGDAWDQQIRQHITDCALFVPLISANTQARPEGYFRLEWKLAVDRSQLMAAEKPFLVPIVVDATTESEALVPRQFREVQWTSIRAGEVPAEFVERISALLSKPISRDVSGVESGVGRARPRRLVLSVLALAVAALVVSAITMRGGRIWRKPAPSELVAGATFAPPRTSPAAASDHSVAVLPFVDMSEAHDQEYFSDGLSEELIDLLVKVAGLRVPARTSSFYFKGKQTTIAQVASELRVANVVEGSVRKVGDRVRITAQLIRVDTGYHLWSETYDRRLDDIFRVQDEIAKSVVDALKISLLGNGPPTATGTTSTDAYALYLQARALVAHHVPEDVETAAQDLRRVLQIDPTYAPAWALYAKTRTMLLQSNAIPFRRARDEARDAASRAIAADPNFGAAHMAMVRFHMFFDWDWNAAASELAIARRLDPFDADTIRYSGSLAMTLGRAEEALSLFQSAAEHDPLDGGNYLLLGRADLALGRFTDAQLAFQRSVALHPNLGGHSMLGDLLRMSGKPEAALKEYELSEGEDDRLVGRALTLKALGRDREADATLATLEANYADADGYEIACIYAGRGDFDQVFTWLVRAYDQHDQALTLLKLDPSLRAIVGDPRYPALLRKMKLPE
jgi:TolB-like protein/tetratricopeptide (TPR) repeat protein